MKKDWKLPSLKAAQIRTPQEAAIERSLFALDPQARSLSVGPALLYSYLWLSGE